MSASFPRFADQLDYSMLIVTASDGRERAGCLVGFATQCSIHPARFIVCISDKNRTYRVVQGADHVAVHVVAEAERELAQLFGGETGDRVDKFADVEHRDGPGGAPIVTRCRDWFVGRILERVDAGDHVALLLAPVEVAVGDDLAPLMFREARTIAPGHEP